MQKIRKILRAVSVKAALPNKQRTNQSTNQLFSATPILQDLADAGPKTTYLLQARSYKIKNHW